MAGTIYGEEREVSSDSGSSGSVFEQLIQRLLGLVKERMSVTIERESPGASGAVIDNLGRRLDNLDDQIDRMERQIRSSVQSSDLSESDKRLFLLKLRLALLRDEQRRVTIERESPSASDGALHHLGIRLDRLDSEIADVERQLG